MSKRVLIIEDDRQLCEELKEYLDESGFPVSFACTPQEGKDLLRSQPFDILLLDYKLPDENGIDLLDAIKDEVSHLKIFFITASLAVANLLDERNLSYLVSGVFTKPFEAEDLLETLKRHFPPSPA
jgi:DNA-binding response OmpR family regulator